MEKRRARNRRQAEPKRPQRPYVGDAGSLPQDASGKASVTLSMVLFSLITGFVIGLAVWALFWLSTALTNLVWNGARGALNATPVGGWWLPVVLCPLGGLIIGLFTAGFGGAPEEIETVMGQVQKNGGYRLDNPAASAVSFLLPLVFGGSIGPEAGLTGIIAAACTRIGELLRSAGLRIVDIGSTSISAVISAVFAAPLAGLVVAADGEGDGVNPSAYDFRRGPKLVLYFSTALGACGAVMLFNSVFGPMAGMPRFEGITPESLELLWVLPCMALGYAGAFLFTGSSIYFTQLSASFDEHPVLKPVVAGLVMGFVALFLPNVMFPGEEQAFEVMENWQQVGAFVLLATGLLKCVITPLCLTFGWRGGHFFPLIFGGISMGYGIAALSGVDPMFCVAITTATLVACVQRKPLMALGLLLLCFPVSSMFWMAGAAVIGAALPLPKQSE